MLETSNFARKYTHICSFRKYTFQCLGPFNFADVSFFFLQKISVFCPKNYIYSKQQCESCNRDFLVMCSVFVRQKVTINEKINFADSLSGIWPPDCSKLAKNPINDNDVTIFRHDVIINLFDVVLFLLSILYTGPSFMSISSLVLELSQFSFIRDRLETRKSETPQSEFCPTSGDRDKLWMPNLP